LSYVGDLFLDSAKSYAVGKGVLGLYGHFFPDAMQKTVMSEDELMKLYISVLDKIHAKSPRARVYLVEYLTLLGPDVEALIDAPLTVEQIEHHKEIASKLQKATAKAAEARKEWCECIPMHQLSQKHGIGSKEPWVEGFGLGMLVKGVAPYHPNAAGHSVIAGILYEKLKK
jgi:hypothetical protein